MNINLCWINGELTSPNNLFPGGGQYSLIHFDEVSNYFSVTMRLENDPIRTLRKQLQFIKG